MEHIKSDSELKILDAAKDVFYHRGFAGARMQEIADKAGINKAMLHYYYRNKEKLFEAVFIDAINSFIPDVKKVLNSDIALEKKIVQFVDIYISNLLDKPYIPGFVLYELSRNPDALVKTFLDFNPVNFDVLQEQLGNLAKGGITINVDPRQFALNLLALCIFPFIAKPMIQGIFNMDLDDFKEFMNERKKIIPELIFNSIKKV